VTDDYRQSVISNNAPIGTTTMNNDVTHMHQTHKTQHHHTKFINAA